MAIAATTYWHALSGATAAMVNGGGFNTANANFVSDFTTDTNTGNTSSPVISSASYNFDAGDVGAWFYVKSGTNWTPGFYQIASVASNKATLSAAIGAALIANPITGEYDTASTAAGCATVGTPTSGTGGITYARQNTADLNITDLACTTPSTTVTSVTGGFTKMHVGNIMHITAITGTGTLTGWYEIVSFTDTNTVVLDRTPAPTNNATAGTIYVGGALDLTGSLFDTWGEQLVAGNTTWIKSGTYTPGAAYSISANNGTATNPINYIGYKTLPGDTCNDDDRPLFVFAANTFSLNQFHNVYNIRATGTAAQVLTGAAGGIFVNCKAMNTSTSGSRYGIQNGSNGFCVGCEGISLAGFGLGNSAGNGFFDGCTAHDSSSGMQGANARFVVDDCIVWACTTAALHHNSANSTGQISGCTLYGSEAKVGTGILLAASASQTFAYDNIIYGFVTGISQTTSQLKSNFGRNNALYNNTTNYSNFYQAPTSVTTVDPGFSGLGQLSGSTATISGSTLTQTGAFASNVTDGVSFLHVTGGTGATVGIYPIVSHDNNSVTVTNTIGTNATADKTWTIHYGFNFASNGAI